MVSVDMAVSCGVYQTIVLCENGEVFACGTNTHGLLGLGMVLFQKTFARVAGLPAAVRQVAAGSHHTGIVTDTGDLLMFGNGESGPLGLGDEDDRTTPTLVPRAVFDGEAVLMVACGYEHTAAVTEGGGVYTFGRGVHGRLGHGDEENRFAPRRVPATWFNRERVVMVAAGNRHTVALSEAGHVFTWGYGSDGQLGHGDQEHQWAPRQVEAGRFGGEKVVFVAAGGWHTVAVTAGGRLYTWGDGWYGQLGHGDKDERLVPTLVPTAFGGSAVVMVACGFEHTLVVTEDGGLWTCGHGIYGELGLNNDVDRDVFEQVSPGAFDGARVVTAAAGRKHSVAVTEDGGLWTWGSNTWSMLGRSDDIYFTPKRITSSPLDTIRIGRLHNLPFAHVLAFTMAAHERLGATSPIRIVSGEMGLLSMIAQFTNPSVQSAVKQSDGLMRLLGASQQRYQMKMTMLPSSDVP